MVLITDGSGSRGILFLWSQKKGVEEAELDLIGLRFHHKAGGDVQEGEKMEEREDEKPF